MQMATSAADDELLSGGSMVQDMTTEQLEKAVKGLDRPTLLKMLDLDSTRPVVADIPELKPISLHVKRQMTVHSAVVPFLNQGTAVDCCSGAVMRRFGSNTIVIPCFGSEFHSGDEFCTHCAQMWAHMDDNCEFVLQPSMEDAWKMYTVGSRRMIKNWDGMAKIADDYGEDISSIRDTLAESAYAVKPA